jgi:hypothetical protein
MTSKASVAALTGDASLAASTSAIGVVAIGGTLGYGVYATGLNAVYASSSTGTGVEGVSDSGTGVWGLSTTGNGVHAQSGCTLPCTTSDRTKFAVLAEGLLGNSGLKATAADTYAGTFQNGSATYATVSITNGTAGGPGLAVTGTTTTTGNVTVGGNLTVTGTVSANVKSFVVDDPADATRSIWYASLEGPEAAMYVRGKATLAGGRARVTLPDHFTRMVAPGTLTASLTPRSADSLGVAATSVTPAALDIRELHGGRGSYDVDWVVYGVRKGFEDFQVIRPKIAPP